MRVILPVLGFLVRYDIGTLGKRMMVISYPGEASTRQYSMPLGYLRLDGNFIVVDAGGNTPWYQKLQALPDVRVHASGGPFDVRIDFISDPADVARALDGYKKIYGGRYERFLGVPASMPAAEAAHSPRLSASFVRLQPLQVVPALIP
jgi:hypothetical protein